MTLGGEQAEGGSGAPASLGSSTDCGCHLTSIRTHGPPVAFTVHLTVCVLSALHGPAGGNSVP